MRGVLKPLERFDYAARMTNPTAEVGAENGLERVPWEVYIMSIVSYDAI